MPKFTLLFACIILLALYSVQAFCVYSFLDEGAAAIRVSNVDRKKKSFAKILEPGDNSCCHWSNKNCNPGGQQKSVVAFNVEHWFGISEYSSNPSSPATLYCEAGGSIAFRGSSSDNFRFVCTQTDGTEVFSYVKDLSQP